MAQEKSAIYQQLKNEVRNMKFQYVCNAGIVLASEDIRIGIDCFCKDTDKLYQDTPSEVRKELLEEIENGKLQSLIFTHEHEDHCCPEYVKEAWEKNQNLQIYATKKVIEILREWNMPAINLYEIGDGDTFDVGTINVKCIQSTHEGEQYANVQNLTLLIKKEDKYLAIIGDAKPCKQLFEKITTWSPHIDWLFAPFPYVGLHSTRKLMKEALDISHIFVLHQPRQEADTQNWVANAKRVNENAKDGLPKAIFPEKLGEWYLT